MDNVNRYLTVFCLYISLKLNVCEVFPFLIQADQIFVKCSDGKLESFNNNQFTLPTCIEKSQIERINVFQIYIQCPDGRLHFELNRTFPFHASSSEYSLTSLHPHCFIDKLNHNRFISYQTRYLSENGTFAQIISFQCEGNSTVVTNEQWKFHDEFYLFFKLMNYGLCRYLVQLVYSNGKCNRFYQQIYKIQLQIKQSICYYQIGLDSSDISLEYLNQLVRKNLSLNIQAVSSNHSMNSSIMTMIITTSITGLSLILCGLVFILMYRFTLLRR
ncbi:unnamed protein product [Adineta ricciae]|uniref:Uncharacterized protein n=1 Tax=Adineta ricciae TaxID=249248 RepID=A0A813URH1_ADIRI|nr:unnamed protein product [Adineta ricciae]CAF1265209.1 unnamed protein product [Adineta ricciae]